MRYRRDGGYINLGPRGSQSRPSHRALRQPASIHGDHPLILDHGRP